MTGFGEDLSKWFITRAHASDGRWHVCPPHPGNGLHRGASFPTGAQALAAFAEGGAR